MEVVLTTHAERRARQRLGIPRSAVQRRADLAARRGLWRRRARGELRRYLDKVVATGERGTDAVVDAGAVWLVSADGVFLTVWTLPGGLT